MNNRILFFFFFISFIGHGQENPNSKEYISVGTGVSFLTTSLSYQGKGLNEEKVLFILKPNESLYWDFYFRYRWLDFEFSLTPKFFDINDDDHLKGETKYFNIGFTFFLTPKIRQYLNFNQMKGFYISNTHSLFTDAFTNTDRFILFPDYKITSFSGETNYLWIGNKESNRSYNNLTYYPEKSSFILMTGLSYRYLFNQESSKILFPDGEIQDISEDSRKYQDLRIALKTGGGMQKKFFSGCYFMMELYPQLVFSSIPKQGINEFNFGLNGTSRLGYDNGKWFMGGLSSLNWVNNSSENFYSNTQWQFRFFIGYRFKSPKIMNKTFDTIESKF